MRKNPNKTAGNWGALKNKPQNLVPFKVGGKVKVTAGGEKHVVYKKTTKKGEGKVGNIMVNHPTKDKGVWDTIDLTKKSGAKTVKQGVASTKKWHKENPYNDMKKKLTKKQTGGSSLIDKARSNAKTIAKTPGPKGNVKFTLKGGDPFGPGANTPYIVDTTGLAAGKKSFPMRYGPGVPAAGKRVGNMTDTTVKEVLERTKKTANKKQMGGAKKYQAGGTTAADKVAQQRAINAKRKEEALARTEKAKADARAKIDQAQKNKPVVKPVEPVAPAVTPNRRSESEYRTVTANPKIATIEMYDNKKVLRDSDRTRKNGNRVVVQKTKEGDTVTRTKKVYNPSKETLTTKTKTYDRGDRKATKVQTKNTTSTKPKPIKPIWGDPHTLKKGGSVKKYQAGGSMIKPSPYMDRATKAKLNSSKTRDLEAQMKKAADRRGFYDSIKPTPKKKK